MNGVVGLDIGGANLKGVHSAGGVQTVPFALWKHPDQLARALADLLALLPRSSSLAVTMTGELCDCFASKREGVQHILTSVAVAGPGREVQVWSLDGSFVSLDEARANPLRVAAANWHALATLAASHVEETGLLIDIGSTTTDIIPFQNGKPVARGQNDPERLRTGELVYTGLTRTPLCALLAEAGAAEFFATTLDVQLVLGELPEQPTNTDTADGRPATQAASHARLARMLCADLETSSEAERLDLADRLAKHQRHMIAQSLRKVIESMSEKPTNVVITGTGAFLAERVLDETELDVRRLRAADLWGTPRVDAACAHAVASLASR